MEPFGLVFCAEQETNGRIGAGFPNGAPQREKLLSLQEHARLIQESLRKAGTAQDVGGADAQCFQLRESGAGKTKVLIHQLHSDLREAISIEKRYFPSDMCPILEVAARPLLCRTRHCLCRIRQSASDSPAGLGSYAKDRHIWRILSRDLSQM